MRAVAVIGPSQSGKSTLVDGMATLDGGRAQKMEMHGGSAITEFTFMDEPWAALEAPGGHDAFSQVGPILAACDAAILCVPAQTDASVLAAPYLRCLDEAEIPTFLFINKLDAATERVADIIASLQDYCRHGIVLRQVPIRDGETITGVIDLISERAWEYHEGQRSSLVELPDSMMDREQEARSDLLEAFSDFDDDLLEQIIEDKTPGTSDVYSVSTRVLQHHDLVPAFLGAAVHGNGLQRLLKSLRHEAPRVDTLRDRLGLSGDVRAAVCLADQRKHLGKIGLLRALEAGVGPKDRLGGDDLGNLNQLDGKTPVPGTLDPGAFALTIKSDHIAPRHFLTAEAAEPFPEWAATNSAALKRSIHPVHERDEGKLSAALARLAEIDPGMTITQDEVTGAPVVAAMGQQHLKGIETKLADVFGIAVESDQIPAALRETIRGRASVQYRHRKQSGGAGQFAEVLVEVGPRKSGSGFAFSESVKGGAVPRNYIPAVEHGAREALTSGPNGYKVVDIAVELKDGKAHSVDSSDFAFRTAGQLAVKQALGEAGTVVLQPIMEVEVHVPTAYAGSLVQLFNGLKGQVLGFETHPTCKNWDIFRAMLPMAVRAMLSVKGFARRLT